MSNADIKERLNECSKSLFFLVGAVDEIIEADKGEIAEYMAGSGNILDTLSLELSDLSNKL